MGVGIGVGAARVVEAEGRLADQERDLAHRHADVGPRACEVDLAGHLGPPFAGINQVRFMRSAAVAALSARFPELPRLQRVSVRLLPAPRLRPNPPTIKSRRATLSRDPRGGPARLPCRKTPDDVVCRAATTDEGARELSRGHGFVVAAFVIVFGGCVTLTPQQQETVADVQRFADGTATTYNLPRIRVTIEPATNLGIGGRYRQGNFYLNARTLGSGNLTALVAHELAHYVLGHEPLSGPSMAELQRVQELRELDANAKAVEILMRVRGMSQTEAVRTMATRLRRAQAVTGCGGALAPGHRPPADEIADLLARFPDSAPLLAELEESIPLDSKDPRASAGAPAAEKPAAPSAVAAIRVPVPVWKPGDTWTFCLESPTGKGMYVWSVDREERVEGVAHYVIKQGTREIFYRTADLA